MIFLSFKSENNDPILGKLRKGNSSNPYRRIVETLQVANGKAHLTELPTKFDKVHVTGLTYPMYEKSDGDLSRDTYVVDYTEGVVYFHPEVDAQYLVFSYMGRGAHFFPSTRVYLKDDPDFFTAEEKFDDIDRELLVQQTRINEGIRQNPQPTEVVDMRVDYDGKVYPTAKNRIDAEQKKIQTAQIDLYGKKYGTLKERIDTEQNKIDQAMADANGKPFLTLRERINSEQKKIEDAYVGINGKKYPSLKNRLDTNDHFTETVDRKVANSVNDMKTGDFKDGQIVQTLGYRSIGDGGGAFYLIGSQSSLSNSATFIKLNNGKTAKLIFNEPIVTAIQFGAIGDGKTDDSQAFAILESTLLNRVVDLLGKTYYVSSLPQNNKYANGSFKIPESARIHEADYSLVNRTGNSTSIYIGKDAGKKSLLFTYEAARVGSYNNVAIGYEALTNNVKGYRNIAIGYMAMRNNVEGYYNVAIGDYALADTVGTHSNDAKDNGSRNTAVGTNAGRYNTTGRMNTFVGRNSGHASTTGDFNTAVGYNAYSGMVAAGGRHDVKTAHHNTMMGYNSGFNTNNDFNTALGSHALYFNETGRSNVAIGYKANYSNLTANNNVTIGVDTMRDHNDPNGHDNTAIGTGSMSNILKGNSNTAIGRNSLATTIAGNDAIYYSGCVGLGANTRISGDHQVQIGNSATTAYAYGAIQNRSDIRDKTDVRDTLLGLDFINKIRPVDYKWDYRDDYKVIQEYIDENGEKKTRTVKLPKDGSRKRNRYHHGVIAQEVKSVINELGVDFGGFQDHSINGGDDVLSIGYEEFIAPLIRSVQELSKQVVTLTKEVNKLKGNKDVENENPSSPPPLNEDIPETPEDPNEFVPDIPSDTPPIEEPILDETPVDDNIGDAIDEPPVDEEPVIDDSPMDEDGTEETVDEPIDEPSQEEEEPSQETGEELPPSPPVDEENENN